MTCGKRAEDWFGADASGRLNEGEDLLFKCGVAFAPQAIGQDPLTGQSVREVAL